MCNPIRATGFEAKSTGDPEMKLRQEKGRDVSFGSGPNPTLE